MNKPDFYKASDYAGLSFKNGGFYYGYECSICTECGNKTPDGNESCPNHEDAGREWCFNAKFDNTEIVIPFSKLGTKDMFDVLPI